MKWDRTKGRPEPIHALNLIPEIENGEPLVDLREVAPRVRLPRETTIPYVRETVAQMMNQVVDRFPAGVNLAVTDAFRPLIRQQMIFEMMWRFGEEAFPGLSYAQMRRKICRWVAPFDQKAPPGHCTGAAVDVILVNDAGEELDVTSPFERFSAAPTYTLGLSETAQRNRSILVETMLEVGFSNCRDEWWHYSYGDAGWAVRLEKPTCFYGLKELPEEVYAEAQAAWIEAFKGRPNPFLGGLS